VITGEENVGEDYFERVLDEGVVANEVVEEIVVSPEVGDTVEVNAATSSFADYMNSIGVSSSEEDDQVETTFAQSESEVSETAMTDSMQEEVEETPAPAPKVRKERKPFGESIVGRFKGFFENDEAVN